MRKVNMGKRGNYAGEKGNFGEGEGKWRGGGGCFLKALWGAERKVHKKKIGIINREADRVI